MELIVVFLMFFIKMKYFFVKINKIIRYKLRKARKKNFLLLLHLLSLNL
jgi:hypothetical protein